MGLNSAQRHAECSEPDYKGKGSAAEPQYHRPDPEKAFAVFRLCELKEQQPQMEVRQRLLLAGDRSMEFLILQLLCDFV